MKTVEWYFDFVSPFSYLQLFRLAELPDDVEIAFRPVLFAGLLGHWGHKGPAEIPPKRLFTMRHVAWLARRDAIPYTLPPAFPFNPIRALRLCIALGNWRDVVEAIFRCIWRDGLLPDDDIGWRAIAEAVGADDADGLVADAEVKAALIANGERALARGIYGVPTFDARGELFWGGDTTDFFIEFLRDPALLEQAEFARIAATPSSVPLPGA
ncbi:MAG: 2-hydroxychromene-2-carboxylate isomerase [Rhodospirillales bacterium]|jgi:2-hydroxychromene-2-carboxylate isomerase|nr:2-hydroxychromene-2-carboxylate isomerase [Rhodospirillales bacterium]HJO73175.1 2-hydroxychromene-2-carboxylate isomerase [Rhodospirillales bacterium]